MQQDNKMGRESEFVTRRFNSYLIFAVCMALTLLCGCAADKAYDQGVYLFDQGDYDMSITKLTEAAELSERGLFDDFGQSAVDRLDTSKKAKKNKIKPKSKYRLKLAEALKKGSVYHYDLAKIDVAKTDLGRGKKHLMKAIEYDANLSRAISLLVDVENYISASGDIRKQAFDLSAQNKWDEAVATMSKAIEKYRSMPGAGSAMAKLKLGAYNYFVKVAQGLLDDDDRAGATAKAKHAMTFASRVTEATAVLDTVSNRDQADKHVAEAEQMLSAGQCVDALKLLVHAKTHYPTRPGLEELLVTAKKAVCDIYIRQGRGYMEERQFSKALRNYNKAKRLLPGYGNIDNYAAEASHELADIHLEMARAYDSRNLHGNALLHQLMNLGYRPGDLEAAKGLNYNREHFKKQVRYVIGFAGFKSSARNKGVSDTLEVMGLTHLNKVKPSNVLIMDRTDLKRVMDEINLSLTDMVDPEFRIESGKIKGVDAIVIGQLLDSKVLRNQSSSTGHTTYQSGMKSVTNPKYAGVLRSYESSVSSLDSARRRLRHVMDHAAEKRRLTEGLEPAARNHYMKKYNKRVSSARDAERSARSDMMTKQTRLYSTPREISVPNILDHSYVIQNISKTCKISCFIKMLDTMTGSIIYSEKITGTYSQSDRFIESDSYHNVTGDSLDLPNDVAMIDRTIKRAAEKLNRSLANASKKHGQRFATSMQKDRDSNDIESAAENCMKYLFAYPVYRGDTNKMLAYLESLVSEEKDLLKLESLLRKHCGLLR